MKKLLIALFTLTLFVSCTSSTPEDILPPPKDYTAQNDKEITDYLAKNNLTATKTSTGLYYIIKTEGTGKQPSVLSTVTVKYKGYYTSGKTFDQSKDAAGATFPLNKVIQGWKEGIPFFKEGGTGVLLIPSHLGYGSYDDPRGVPAGSVLIFDIELISVN
ncbi:FKBP-type peptidyl-prolyl cis-trans isomerase [Flavobacterium sharifuzzamanii]|uniref:FKBP-type peptidyl-prolyl cis-trans isomerase n=1 Tax=Flavobacterium sharifuzzamanii TaxID=2211133 RepID=UPI000DAE41C4|nr:FKBP-type peptidyl-prolyl cis-trans isomerase [Flavobacterium sharifuzzamanii]KAF2079169.1 peptidylprolyl isomerase [Flavobacterium sharifuzzamanii]